jgi:hypothetical protein
VACFYILPQIVGQPRHEEYYRAIYLYQRTLKDLVNGVAMKCDVEPTKVTRTIRTTPKGLEILLDDEAVLEIPEGQDMVIHFQEIESSVPFKKEWDSGAADVQVDGDMPIETLQSTGYELRLQY